MILKKNRFIGPFALKRFLPKSKNVKMPMFALKYQQSNRQDWRAAVIVSKKVHKSAVVRNRIRRRFFEALRLQSGHFTAPYDIAFIVFNEKLADIDAKELKSQIEKSLKKAKIVS